MYRQGHNKNNSLMLITQFVSTGFSPVHCLFLFFFSSFVFSPRALLRLCMSGCGSSKPWPNHKKSTCICTRMHYCGLPLCSQICVLPSHCVFCKTTLLYFLIQEFGSFFPRFLQSNPPSFLDSRIWFKYFSISFGFKHFQKKIGTLL